MKLWLLFARREWDPTDPLRDYHEWELVGVFPYEKAAVMVGVPMAAAEPHTQLMVQRWTLGQVGPDENEEMVN